MVLLISILLLTGCYNDIVSDDTNTILNTFLGKNTKLVNTYSEGYKIIMGINIIYMLMQLVIIIKKKQIL